MEIRYKKTFKREDPKYLSITDPTFYQQRFIRFCRETVFLDNSPKINILLKDSLKFWRGKADLSKTAKSDVDTVIDEVPTSSTT